MRGQSFGLVSSSGATISAWSDLGKVAVLADSFLAFCSVRERICELVNTN